MAIHDMAILDFLEGYSIKIIMPTMRAIMIIIERVERYCHHIGTILNVYSQLAKIMLIFTFKILKKCSFQLRQGSIPKNYFWSVKKL